MKKWFENLKISKKLSTCFLFVIILSVLVGCVGIFSILHIDANDTKLYKEDTVGLNYAGDTAVEYMQLRYNAVRRLSASDKASIAEAVKNINDNITQIDALLIRFQETVSDPELLSYSQGIQGNWGTYKANMQKENEAALKGETVIYNQEIATLGNTLRDSFKALFDMVSDEAAAMSDSNSTSASNAVIIMVVVIALSAVISLWLSRYISDIISKPMQKFAAFAELVSVGDLDVSKIVEEKDRLWALRKDEVGVLADAFDRMILSTNEQSQKTRSIADGDLTTTITIRSENDVLGKALSELVEKFHGLTSSIVAISHQVNTGAEQVSDAAQALASGTTEQAATIEELNASVTHITQQAEQNASHARAAAASSQEANAGVNASSAHMQSLNLAMREIGSASEKITGITKVIEDIAFQTNILALNAAIEAARAGTAGKGFAVVADEVRNLAAKSAEAAKQTADLIRHSVETVSAGEKLSAEAAQILNVVAEKTALVGRAIQDIDVASSEQALAIDQINQGLSQVSSVVQTNAATAEESSASSEELAAQAQTLQQEVGKFKLRKDERVSGMSELVELTLDNNNTRIPKARAGISGKY
ncbi:MAG TPA: methyl-accepting chemotaxis protein [Clostridia bacterium]|nr:methyl-accepting chemotaxis protein [Clostridia bacterium]